MITVKRGGISAFERTAGCLAIVLFAMGAPVADACSVSVPWVPYVNVVRLTGPKVEGMVWARAYNILDYTGGVRVLVSAVLQGVRRPVVRWENGQECIFDAAGGEECHENRPNEGVLFESLFAQWKESADRAGQLPRVWLPLIVEMDGREIRMTLRSQAVRNNRRLQGERAGRITNEVCEALND
jgi:hypothetical protein